MRYVAYMDPQGGEGNPENGQYAYDAGAGWAVVTNVSPVPVHVMDLVVTADGIFLFGAANEPDPPNGGATVWLSTDGGATWSVDLAPRPDPTNWARFYAATVIGSDLFAVMADGTGGSPVYRRSGGVWSRIESMAPVSELIPFTVNDVDFAVVIPEGKGAATSQSGDLGVLTAAEDNGQRAALLTALPATIRDAVAANGFLYVLDFDYTIWRVDSAGVKTELLSSLVPVCSLAVTDGHVYFGTRDSKIYKTALPG